MTWPALELERRRFSEVGPNLGDYESKYMSKGWIIKARMPAWPGHNVSWFWIPLGNCTACKFFTPDPPDCTNPNSTIRERFYEYVNGNTCPGFVAGQQSVGPLGQSQRDLLDVMMAAGLADGEPSQPVEILQKVPWSPWQSHQAHAQQEAFLAMARANDYGQQDRSHGQDLGDIEA